MTTERQLLLQQSWRRAWNSLGVGEPDEKLRDRLLAAHQEAHRHYHTLQHLLECVEQLETVLDQLQYPGEVELALWFHDAVYVMSADDNELRSALWAKESILQAGLSQLVAERIHGLVMVTRHQELNFSPDGQLLADIDLVILGAPARRFDEYELQVREENALVPEDSYQQRRSAILRGFLARPCIYRTEFFRQKLEVVARENLQRSLEHLTN